MSPRAGGEAAKFGEHFEGRWTVWQVLAVLAGQAMSIVVEDEAELAVGAEFTLRRSDGSLEVHQVKRQPGMAASWSLSSLRDAGVLAAAAFHADAGRSFRFVSTVRAPWLERLADAARRSEDAAALVRIHADLADPRRELDALAASAVWGSPERAWRVLRVLRVSSLPEDELEAMNAAVAAVYLQGAAPSLMAVGLGDLVMKSLGLRLDASTIHERLGDYGMAVSPLVDRSGLAESVAATRDRWTATVTDELLATEIIRTESEGVEGRLRADPNAIVLVAGNAGAGKSTVLHQVVGRLSADGWPVLAMRIDRLEPFATQGQLAAQLELPKAPASALGALAAGEPCLLLVDQLDAVSLASGRLPRQIDPIKEMLRQTRAFAGMRVLMACRQYDLDNDSRLRSLVAQDGPATLQLVGPLDDQQIDRAVTALGFDPTRLSVHQRTLLSCPLHLVLLAAIADQANALAFRGIDELFAAFYDRKESDCRERKAPGRVRFGSVITALANVMSARQRLSVPRSVLEADDLTADGDVLISEHVLIGDRHQVAFFHEAFFDYVFGRAWVAGDAELRTWLRSGEQELFRRAQVRQILLHLHAADAVRFRRDVRACLTDEAIRFHIKEVILAVLAALQDPSSEDWQLVSDLSAMDPPLGDQLWLVLRREPWFRRLDTDGLVERWLAAGDESWLTRALDAMGAGAGAHGERMSELLEIVEPHPNYAGALLWIVRAGQGPHTSRALFDRLLRAVRDGQLNERREEVFMYAYRLPEREPGWAAELLAAWLADRPGALTVEHQRIADLQGDDPGVLTMIGGAGGGAPLTFARLLAPYMVAVMHACAFTTSERPIQDAQFYVRDSDNEPHTAGDHLLGAMGRAMRHVGEEYPEALEDLLAPLLAEPYDAAQWLAYQALIGAGPAHAGWAASVLTEGGSRLECSYRHHPTWTTRELLLATSEHLDDTQLAALEAAILVAETRWRAEGADHAMFALLSALPEGRLSRGAVERLMELRRRFGLEQPSQPEPTITAFTVESPIPEDETQAFSDDQWLAAMREHDSDPSFDPGARELAAILERAASREPERFAAIALRLDASFHPAYAVAILKALADPSESVTPQAIFDALRHLAPLGEEEIDRFIGWPLRTVIDKGMPRDILELLLDLARHGRNRSATSHVNPAPGDAAHAGFQTAQGQAINVLALVVAHDVDGSRTAAVQPALPSLVADPNLATRIWVAQLMSAMLRHARAEVLEALPRLLDTEDRLLAEAHVQNLCIWAGNGGTNDAATAIKVAYRALRSTDEGAREFGGLLAAYAALEWEHPEALGAALAAGPAARRGLARLCARRLPVTRQHVVAGRALIELFYDADETVRSAAAEVAAALRDAPLQPHAELVRTLVMSPAFDPALAQLLITLEHAPDRIDELLALTTDRFVDRFGADSRSLATAAAHHADQIGRLLLRWYTQTEDHEQRRSALDRIDLLLAASAFGVAELVGEAER